MEVKQTERTKTFKEISAELKIGKESVTSKCADLTKDVVARMGVCLWSHVVLIVRMLHLRCIYACLCAFGTVPAVIHCSRCS